ncbi:MAG: hypothetical protein HY290_25570, partial [Planctomycetia bacterium]|nr:hypothetical protein [Planctomycetia bacterium]
GSAASALTEYQSRRRTTSETFADQLLLADWCRMQKLADQERAHLNAALAVAPPDEIERVRVRLGWRRIGGFWFSREDLLEWQKLNQATDASLKRWQAKCDQVARNVDGSARQRDAALAALKEIDEASAVPALELTLAGRSEESARAVVRTLGRIAGPESSLALARQAVFSQWPEVRNSAAAALKSRTLEDFVPPLIGLLATPVRTELQVTAPALRRTGNRAQFAFVVSLVLSRETGNQFQVAAFQTTNLLINEALNPGPGTQAVGGDPAQIPGFLLGREDALRTTADQTDAQRRTIETINAQTADLNDRIGAVLAAVSGNESRSEPKFWWDWWKTHSEIESAGPKPTAIVTEEFLVGNPQSGYAPYECLAAGTLVRTDSGLLPIEKISVGDLVLSQDVDTGEIAYKPILRTTIRPPKELCSVRFDQETVVLTGGHHLWSSGAGWIKARDLETQTLIHTVTGNAPVWTVRKGETAQTYNLVVADYHTYFVGKTGILSHDVLTPRGTSSLVPGLSRANAVARNK